MSTPGYYRFPTIWKDQIVFVSEDDLWKVTLTSPKAERLTATKGAITRPHFSPDGKWLAFSATEEGHTEIYLMPSEGGEPKRLTYLGAISKVVGWSPDGKILFTSNGKSPSPRIFLLYSLSPEGGIPVQLPVGPANHISFGSQNRSVLGRNTGEPAYWKRYRGGRVGVLWVDNQGNGENRDRISQLSSPAIS
ncbi:MAG: hypothetical protein D6785_12680 [Planctomycetota bacterium]|nr:MAG: hypothetical protein D6785_12680 [Planctomycetota bacterium]